MLAIPAKVQQQVDKLEADAVKADGDAARSLSDYNKGMAKYAQSGKKSDYDNAQKDLKKSQDAAARAAQNRQQEATLLGKYNQATYEDHVRGYNGIYDGFVARTIKVESKTHIHYDETLRTAGPVNHYEIVNWFEDSISHDAAGGAEKFWWPTP